MLLARSFVLHLLKWIFFGFLKRHKLFLGFRHVGYVWLQIANGFTGNSSAYQMCVWTRKTEDIINLLDVSSGVCIREQTD